MIGRPEFKLIIMSATVDEKIFVQYYSQFRFGIVNIGGERAFPITSIFLKKPITEKEYIETGLEIIDKILKETTVGDILFFVTSVNETLNTCKMLGKGDDYCIEVYAGINAERQELAQDKDMYKDKFNKKRKVVIATNVAESSLTIDGIKFVVDSGLELHGCYDPKIRARILEKGFITHAQATQRMGRAGRVESGTCYHLYTEETFNKMKKFPDPVIKTSNIWSECLNLLNLSTIRDTITLSDILRQFIEPPQKQYVDDAIAQLKQLDLINTDNEISDLGILVSQMQMDPSQAVAVYTAWHLHCAKEVVAILCMIDAMKGNLGELFVRPENIVRNNEYRLKQVIEQQKKAKQKLAHETGDHLSCLNIYTKYVNLLKTSETEINDFIYSHFLRRDILDRAKIYFHKMMGIVFRLLGDTEKEDMGDLVDKKLEHRILASLFSGFKLNEAVFDKKTKKYNTSHLKNVNISQNSFCTFFESDKKKLMYYELFGTSTKTELVITSNIEHLKS
jgi:pre-mRNA-splicing factor ATP-dependent RNA helicase DHX15/PRP43